MYKLNAYEADLAPVNEEGAEGVQIQWLLAEANGAPNFAMRRFVIAPGGHTPYHQHDWEHEVYTLTGEGIMTTEDGEHPIEPGDTILIAPNELHNFDNTGDEPLEFLCLVPNGPATEGH